MDDASAPAADLLPPTFRAWFAGRGWRPRPHQLAMIQRARAGRDALLIAPTGGGKTLAGFLPSLVELSEPPRRNARPGQARDEALDLGPGRTPGLAVRAGGGGGRAFRPGRR